MAKRERVIMDLDAVVGDFFGAAVPFMNEFTGKSLQVSDINNYNIFKIFEIEPKDFFALIEKNNVLENMLPFRNCTKAIKKLSEFGYIIDFATARGYADNAHAVTESWLKRNRVHFDTLNIIPDGVAKSDVMKRVSDKFAFAVDDYEKNLFGFRDSGLISSMVLITQPWNLHVNSMPGLSRHKSLSSFAEKHCKALEHRM